MSDRRLLLAWVLLMGLTTLTGVAGAGLDTRSLGALWLAVLVVVTVAKARLILARYLRLERAPGFLSGFTAAIVMVTVIVGLSILAIHRPLMRPLAAPSAPSSAHAAPVHVAPARPVR